MELIHLADLVGWFLVMYKEDPLCNLTYRNHVMGFSSPVP
jgi:hypothetical protein